MKKMQDPFDYDEPVFTPTYAQDAPVNKTTLKSMTLLDKLEKLIRLAQGCMMEDKFFKRHKALIESVATDLELTPVEAVMLCPFISLTTCATARSCSAFFAHKKATGVDSAG